MKCVEPEDIIFGGTFDPPHLGHRDLLASALKRFKFARFFVCPAAEPPSTINDSKSTSASFAHRVAMCRLNFQEDEQVSVSEFEKDLPVPNFTVESLRHWVQQSRRSVAILIGADQMMNFVHWREPAEILKLASLVVSPREAVAMTHDDVLDVLKSLDASVEWNEDSACCNAPSFTGGGVFLLDEVPLAAASRHVRKHIKDEESYNNPMLSADVSAYIKKHNLYR